MIGNGPDIPWRIPGEQAWFKQFTLGHTLLMGRTTFESIGRPLPGRTTIVLTRDPGWHHDGVLVAGDLAGALEMAAGLPGDVMVAGGAQVYAAALGHLTDQVISRVHQKPAGDVFYPPFDPTGWIRTRRDAHEGYEREFLTRVDVAADADPDELWPVYQGVWGDQRRDEFDQMWATHSAREDFRVATARRGGVLVGLAWAYLGRRGQWWTDRVAPLLDPNWIGEHWEIVELGVSRSWRGLGLGRGLLRAIIEAAPASARVALLETNEAGPARALYESEGLRALAAVPATDHVVMGRVVPVPR